MIIYLNYDLAVDALNYMKSITLKHIPKSKLSAYDNTGPFEKDPLNYHTLHGSSCIDFFFNSKGAPLGELILDSTPNPEKIFSCHMSNIGIVKVDFIPSSNYAYDQLECYVFADVSKLTNTLKIRDGYAIVVDHNFKNAHIYFNRRNDNVPLRTLFFSRSRSRG